MYNKINLFIQFQATDDLTNFDKINKNLEDICSSKLLYKKILNKFNIYSYIKQEPNIYNYFLESKNYAWLQGNTYVSNLSEENNLNTNLFNLGLENILITVNSNNEYILYDDITIVNNNIINALEPNEDVNIYHYNTLDEVYEHLNYMYVLKEIGD